MNALDTAIVLAYFAVVFGIGGVFLHPSEDEQELLPG